jgi:hypothetical protein
VHVQVTAAYHDAAAMHDATVCTLEQDGKHGLGIFVRPAPPPRPRSPSNSPALQTPEKRWPGWRKQLRWAVSVSLPHGADVRALLTNMPIFPHTVNGSGLHFGALTLTTTNARIALDVRPPPPSVFAPR